MTRTRCVWIVVLPLVMLFVVGLALASNTQAHHKCGHLKPVPGECPPEPPNGNAYVVRIYDYTDRYHDAVAYAAHLYTGYLAPYGVTVEYEDMPAATGAECDAITPPLRGIRACEDLKLEGAIASSTGPFWEEESPGHWSLQSNLRFFFSNPEEEGGLFARSFTCHEIGHSFGLWHVTDAADPNCLTVGTWRFDTLSSWQVEWIGANLPQSSTVAAVPEERQAPQHDNERNKTHGKKHRRD